MKILACFDKKLPTILDNDNFELINHSMMVLKLKKEINVTHKIFSALVILILLQGLSAVNGFADACTACTDGNCLSVYLCDFQDAMQRKVTPLFCPCHPSDTQGSSCQLHRYRVPDIQEPTIITVDLGRYQPNSIRVVETDFLLVNHIQKGVKRRLHVEIISKPTPIYIRRLSLLF